MASIYRRKDSPYWHWKGVYKGKKIYKSTKVTAKKYALKIMEKWNYQLMMEDLSFLGPKYSNQYSVNGFINDYLKHLSKIRSHSSFTISKGILHRLQGFLEDNKVLEIRDVTLIHLEQFFASYEASPKTKKNHLSIISQLFNRAVKLELIRRNHAEWVELPKGKPSIRHRLLGKKDLVIIFGDNGKWQFYYQFLLYSGLRAGDVALLRYEYIDFDTNQINVHIKKSDKDYRLPLHRSLIEGLKRTDKKEGPIFPELYDSNPVRLNHHLSKPRKYLQQLLRKNGRDKATLHSFRHAFSNLLRDDKVGMEDRKILLGHASIEATKIYTHPNEKLASELVNTIPDIDTLKRGTVTSSVTSKKTNKENENE